jgi:dihydrolipoamide dehydrogenase
VANERADVIIIGSGPAGYVGALRAAQLGGNVVVVEKGPVGGTCLNRGCIPTKALFSSVQVLNDCRNAAKYGVEVAAPTPNFGQMIARKDQVVTQLVKGVEFLLQRAKVRVVKGAGAILEPGVVEVRGDDGSTERIQARAIMIATGSEPAALPMLQFDGDKVISSTEALQLTQIPPSMIIIGAGAIGMEFSNIFAALGAQVTVVEMLPQVLPAEDKEIAEQLNRELRKKRIKVIVNTRVERASRQGDEMVLDLSSGETLKAAKVLVAAGRALNTQSIGLEKVGVALEKRWIKVNERMETSVPGIYAVGDVVGGWLLAHVGSKQAMVAAENIMGHPAKMDYRVVPRTVWTSPEVASVGITEEEAVAAGRQVKVGRFPFRALGRAVAMGHIDGMVKLVGDASTDELLGCQMIGPDVSDLIAEVAVAMQLETTVEELANTIHAHPTLPEAIMEAAHVLEGRPLHI